MLLPWPFLLPFSGASNAVKCISNVTKAITINYDLPKVERLQYGDASEASVTTIDAFHDDPMFTYGRDTPDAKSPGRLAKVTLRAVTGHTFIQAVSNGLGLTINHGDAVVIATPAEVDVPKRRGPLQKLHNFLLKALVEISKQFNSPEQRRRGEEINTKLQKLIEDTIGARSKEMMYVNLLATAPAWQGHGYGSALLKVITDEADARGRATYLLSSNINNTEFYNSHGFVSVAEARLGENNPTWRKEPVIVPLMVREPKEKRYDEKAPMLV